MGVPPRIVAYPARIVGALASRIHRIQAHAFLVPGKPTVSSVCEAARDEEGTRVGRYVLIRDEDGCLHALSASAVAGLRECDEGCMLLLTGSRVLRVSHPLSRVLQWLAI